jgi:hypothetical protein
MVLMSTIKGCLACLHLVMANAMYAWVGAKDELEELMIAVCRVIDVPGSGPLGLAAADEEWVRLLGSDREGV